MNKITANDLEYDSIGNVVWRADYKPFGQEQSISGSLENNEKFVGKEKDKETGLYYFGARYMYDKAGRFISPDPVGPVDPWTGKINQKVIHNPQMLNPYAYAVNNPYRYVDPDGRDVWFIGVGTSFFIGKGGSAAANKPTGYGTQASLGLAYDTQSGKFILFSSGGTAQQDDRVVGINAGAGLFVGQLKGDMQDFLGESSEKTRTLIAPAFTEIETSSNKKGASFSFGGKGFGWSDTSITTQTLDMLAPINKSTPENKIGDIPK
ncbi:MAG: RHS repeat-associated core domain-containing protein [Nitrospiraceae bacterium]|nr:RHS repeat-associated core domain-containing protein [Nitrospiraceae bacterium]